MNYSLINMKRRHLDSVLARFKGLPRLKKGYIREIKDALGMSGRQLAARVGVTPQAIQKFQQGEIDGSISLNTLEKVADSLECEFVYAFVPRTTLVEEVMNRASIVAKARAQRTMRTMGLEQQTPTTKAADSLVNEIAQELVLHGGRELWDDV
jgi:predicted DNA-binding mobile mystery protein A